MEVDNQKENDEIIKARAKVETLTQREQEIEKLLCRIYEDNVLGKLPDDRYFTLDKQYSKEKSEISNEIQTLRQFLNSICSEKRSPKRFIDLVEKYLEFDELTTCMINEFVSRIDIHEREEKGVANSPQRIDIYFNFIGSYLPPMFNEVKELTEEELAEQQKIQERRERLHRNYLKRKANGKQTKYYEKTKAEKKAKKDSLNLAARIEDMQNGVFCFSSDVEKTPRIATPEAI